MPGEMHSGYQHEDDFQECWETLRGKYGSRPCPIPDEAIVDSTELLLLNAARSGDTDCMPPAVEYALLSRLSREAAERVWAMAPPSQSATTEWLALSQLSGRAVHLVHPVAFLRLGGTLVGSAPEIEMLRSEAGTSPAARVSIDPTEGTLVSGDGYARRDEAVARLAARFPELLLSDVSGCFSSIRPSIALRQLPRALAAQIAVELDRLGVVGLPVGAVPWRWLGELALSDVDRDLVAAGLTHVRYVDDFWIGVTDEADATRAVQLLAESLARMGLTLNKSKTRTVRSVDYSPSPSTPDLEETCRLLLDGDASERVRISLGLRETRDAQLDDADRRRVLELLVAALPKSPWLSRTILGSIEVLARGSQRGLNASIKQLFKSPWSVVRARGAEFAGRHGLPFFKTPLLALATRDPSPLVHRAALLALLRLREDRAVRAVLQRGAPTLLDRTVHVVACGALGLHDTTPNGASEELLYGVAQVNGLSGPLGTAPLGAVDQPRSTPGEYDQ